jgi:glycosyltransferase involved in cell wall biosynthesis
MDGGPFAACLVDVGVPVTIRARSRRLDPRPAILLARDLLAWRPDVVHSWSWISTLAAGPVCRILGIPLVDGTIQTGAYQPEFLRLNRLGMACATLVVANSQAGLRAWGVNPRRGRVVYNGFDETRLPAAPRRDHNGFTVIMTGRMVPVKQYDVVIAAARLLSRNASGWRFVLVGEGTDRERLRRSASDLVATGIVVFAEPGLEVLDLVRDADVGVLMTNPALAREGLSNSIMEYMALGLPVVCGDGGGNPELVLDGITGFIVPQGSPERLAERLIYLREHPDDARAMGAAGKTRIAEDFSVPTMVERMLAVYNEAIWRQRR